MSNKMVDDLVQSVTYYNPRNILFHGYLAPFFVLQAVIYYFFTDTSSSSSLQNTNSSEMTPHEHIPTDGSKHAYEYWVIAVVVSIAAQVITYLFCHWSVQVKCWLSYTRCSNPYYAAFVKVIPTSNNGSTELVPLIRENINKQSHLWFVFQKTKYFYSEFEQRFKAADFPCNRPISYYKNHTGYTDPNEMYNVEKFYGRNELEMVIPNFNELFKERAMAPFFLFQIFCVCLWCLDEYWYYAVLTLFMLVIFEVILVKHQLRNMQEIRRMGNQPYNVQVFRQSKWKQIKSDQLIPGDLLSIVRSDHNVPCDILLISGSCIVDESTLTGESIPQMKESIENLDDDRILDVDQDKLHIIHGGTKVLQHAPNNKEQACVGYVLKASFNTSQGKLLRTILFGVKRVTANNLETLCFILFLLVFAIIAAIYVWNKGVQDSNRSRYRLFFECTVIVTSVVPPELPIELSLAVNTSLLSLSKLYIYCTEPFRIPFAGKVEYCCFDKTGTLTSDDLVIEGVAGIRKSAPDQLKGDEDSNQHPTKNSSLNILSTLSNHEKVTVLSECPTETLQVLAACHSLAHLEDGLVGDPLEKKVLEAIDWTYMKSGIVSAKKGRSPALKIHQRFHFNSILKRMSVIVGYKLDMSNDNSYIALAKGAPEFMKPLMSKLPDDYDQIYLEMSTLGARVLALGRRDLGALSNQQLTELKRENVEKDLEFAGFVLISCPLKADSKAVCLELASSGHRLVMITGDGALTACHVGRMLEFVHSQQILILTQTKANDWVWQSTPSGVEVPFIEGYKLCRLQNLDLCLTGDSLTYVLNQQDISPYDLIKRVKIFARVSPKQKENVITTLKSHGHPILMCGDGTNDVGALKHADVGVALLTTTQIENANATAKTIQQGMRTINAGSSPASAAKQINSATNKKGSKLPKRAIISQEELKREKIIEAQRKLKEMLAEQDRPTFVKLGDASIAAPFTSRLSSTKCICHIIKQGRCTLVTTLQMFKILALNALISAYCHSVLYIDGIKFSDGQVTIQGLLSTFCFLFISRSKPLKTLSAQRPSSSIFNIYTILTVTMQFFVHFGSLLYMYEESKALQDIIDKHNATAQPITEASVTTSTKMASDLSNGTNSNRTTGSTGFDVHTEFKPSIVNSTIFLIGMSLQVATFMVNYKGHPFMQDFRENKPLCYSFVGSVIFVFVCVTGFLPTLMDQLSVVPFPIEFQQKFLIVICVNFIAALTIDRVCDYLFGRTYLKPL